MRKEQHLASIGAFTADCYVSGRHDYRFNSTPNIPIRANSPA
jgi:hypothetical protein